MDKKIQEHLIADGIWLGLSNPSVVRVIPTRLPGKLA
jgi:hypothetical protein